MEANLAEKIVVAMRVCFGFLRVSCCFQGIVSASFVRGSTRYLLCLVSY